MRFIYIIFVYFFSVLIQVKEVKSQNSSIINSYFTLKIKYHRKNALSILIFLKSFLIQIDHSFLLRDFRFLKLPNNRRMPESNNWEPVYSKTAEYTKKFSKIANILLESGLSSFSLSFKETENSKFQELLTRSRVDKKLEIHCNNNSRKMCKLQKSHLTRLKISQLRVR